MLGRRWRVAVGMEELGASWRLQWRAAGLRELGGCSCEEEGRPEAKWELGRGRADAGGVKAAPRRVVACADRPAATRGRFPRHAAATA